MDHPSALMTPDNDGLGGQTQAQRSANLARIRDNQRRSRARRKEYLSELETKYRACEQVGIEASAEIQAAARRVVDENKKLRRLLRRTGVSDADVDAMLGVDVDSEGAPHMTPANALESLLGVRQQCSGGAGCGGETSCSPTLPSGDDSRGTQSCISPASDRTTPAQTSQYPLSHLPAQLAAAEYQFAHPVASASISTPINNYTQPFPRGPYAMSPAVNPNQQADYTLPHDNPYAAALQITTTMTSHQRQQHQHPDPVDPDSTSCYVAADVIRSIKPDAGFELEEQLGCGSGQECHVPNAHIFSLMDRYSDQQRNG